MIGVDTSVLVPLFIPQVGSEASERLLRADEQWVAPVLWRSEFANLLWKYVKHRGMPTATALAALAQARDLMLDQEYELGLDDVLLLAIDSGCTAYDCEYVALAKRLGLRLATRDKQLLLTFPELTFRPQ